MKNYTIKLQEGVTLQISGGNRKMMAGFGIFNLVERTTCPGSTPKCRECCYAAKASRIYPSVLPRRKANLTASKHPLFVPAMIEAIGKMEKTNGFRQFFRIHEAGDFYCQGYVDAWARIAGKFPEVKFLAFTKSFLLDFSCLPRNVQIVYSIMEDTSAEALSKIPQGGIRAYAGNCAGINPRKTLECPGSCDSCGACWDLGKFNLDVHFKIH